MTKKAIKLKANGRTLAAKCTFSPWGPLKLPADRLLSFLQLGVRVITYSKNGSIAKGAGVCMNSVHKNTELIMSLSILGPAVSKQTGRKRETRFVISPLISVNNRPPPQSSLVRRNSRFQLLPRPTDRDSNGESERPRCVSLRCKDEIVIAPRVHSSGCTHAACSWSLFAMN